MVQPLRKAHESITFEIAHRPDWVRHSVIGSKYDDVIEAALKLKGDKSVVRVLLGGLKFDTLSTGLRIRMAQRKLSEKIHVEQNKRTKEIVIVKGRSVFKRRRPSHSG